MNPAAEVLAQSLLYEGYALYPYTPESTKNATPTPFGIAYPPAYAKANPHAFDHAQIECLLLAPDEARIGSRILFLQAAGQRHQADERAVDLPAASLGELRESSVEVAFNFSGEAGIRVSGRSGLSARPLAGRLWRLKLRVENESPLGSDEDAAKLDRGDALRRSLLSLQLLLETSAGRFVSPLDRKGEFGEMVDACEQVNAWPVLAAPGDDAVLGAPIILPDHPQVAPESRVDLFDNTEIEEALLLHVHALSDSERDAIGTQDPAVREMVDRALATTPDEIMNLHGRLEHVPPQEGHPMAGEAEISAGGRTFRKGEKVLLRPGTERDVYDRMLDGRLATIERLYVDYEGTPHVGVTVDDDAAQQLFRETGRYLYFKADELESAEA